MTQSLHVFFRDTVRLPGFPGFEPVPFTLAVEIYNLCERCEESGSLGM